MGERVYPRDTPPVSGEHPNLNPKPIIDSPPVSGGPYHRPTMSQDSFTSSKMSYPGYGGPQPGTYVVQVPKNQVYRVPPPENAHKYKLYTQRKPQRSRCRCCICATLAVILLLALLLVVAGGVFYLIYIPKAPSYSIESVQIKGVNLTKLATSSVAPTISPVFNVTVKTENSNGKIGVYYEQGSSVNIYHDGVNFCGGSSPAFYQPPKSVTVFSTELSGAGIVLSKSARDKLLTEQKKGEVPLEMDVEIPVKIKVSAVKTWTITVKVSCDVTVNALIENAKVVYRDCRVHAKPW